MNTIADWTGILDPQQIGALVPQDYARYRPAVVDGLAFFLTGLPAPRALAILADQATLPADAGVAQRLVAVVRHSPVLHKLGQVLARDRRLPANLRRWLQTLETLPAAHGLPELRALIERELGPLSRHGLRLDGTPLAEASVAVVTPFVWEERVRGVFKVLKPGIEAVLEQDLARLQAAGAWLDARCHQYGLPAIAYEETFRQVRELLLREVQLPVEQAHLARARAAYAGRSAVVIPEVFPFSTARLTAMARIDGAKATEVDHLPPRARRELATTAVQALVADPIWSPAPEALFHADPHAGNLMVTPERRLAILDWSLAGTLGKAERVGLTQILLGAAILDGARITAAIAALAEATGPAAALDAVVEDALRRLARAGTWPGLDWLTGLLDEAVLRASVRFAGELVLFRKMLHMVAGVARDISASVTLDAALAASFLARFGLEAGWRLLVPPQSRRFATHLSNLDLAEVALAGPATALRYWSLMRA